MLLLLTFVPNFLKMFPQAPREVTIHLGLAPIPQPPPPSFL